MKKSLSVLLILCLFIALFPMTAFAADRTLRLTEDWRLTGDLELSVNDGDVLIIDGTNRYYIYEMGGILKTTGAGAVYLKDTFIYAQADSPSDNSLAALSKAVRGVTVTAPAKDATALILPVVGGYSVNIKSSSNSNVISTNGTITPPSTVTIVTLVFTLTDARGNKADTAGIPLTVPAKTPSGGDSSGDNGGGTTPSPSPTPQPPAAEPGISTTKVDAKVVEALIEKAKQAEASNKKMVVEIKADSPTTASAVDVGIPGSAFKQLADSTGADLKVATGIGNITFDSNAVDSISGKAVGGDINISIKNIKNDSLTKEMQAKVGTRPVYRFSVKSGNTEISDFGGGQAEISIPYKPSPGENVNAIVVYYIDSNGELIPVRGSYDAATGTVNFIVNHFSQYMVGYNNVKFSDVADNSLYASAVTFMAARGIVNGVGGGRFAPESNVTRADFLVMVMNAYGIKPDANISDNFTDAGNKNYAPYLGTAKRLGLTSGIGNNKFAPEANISRQDMLVILYRALNKLGELPTAQTGRSLASFSDANQIAGYAKDAIKLFVEAGVVSGSSKALNPKAMSKRAEVVQVLYNLLSK